MDGSKQGKRVSFKEQEEVGKENVDRDGLAKLRKEVKAIALEMKEFKDEIRQELKVLKVEQELWEKRIKELEVKCIGVEKDIIELGEIVKRGEVEGGRASRTEESDSTGSVAVGRRRSESRESRYSRASSGYSFENSSGGLSDREVGKLKKWVEDREKEERRKNIVIRGIRKEDLDRIQEGWIEEMIREKLGLEIRVTKWWISGSVIIGSLETEDMKKDIMCNKNKLRGERLFIEQDLTWEERNTQRDIARWVKEEKDRGRIVKIGIGRVKINGIWLKWENVMTDRRVDLPRRKLGEGVVTGDLRLGREDTGASADRNKEEGNTKVGISVGDKEN